LGQVGLLSRWQTLHDHDAPWIECRDLDGIDASFDENLRLGKAAVIPRIVGRSVCGSVVGCGPEQADMEGPVAKQTFRIERQLERSRYVGPIDKVDSDGRSAVTGNGPRERCHCFATNDSHGIRPVLGSRRNTMTSGLRMTVIVEVAAAGADEPKQVGVLLRSAGCRTSAISASRSAALALGSGRVIRTRRMAYFMVQIR
jgi:hypothetical protein